METMRYKALNGKNNGGIDQILITDAANVVEVKYDYVNDVFTEIVLKEKTGFDQVDFVEDQALFCEDLHNDNGAIVVKHRLEFEIDAIDANAKRFAQKLAENQNKGVVALVRTNDRRQYIVGYSRNFLCENPLKVETARTESNKKYDQMCTTKISLAAHDNQLAKQLVAPATRG